MCGRETEFLESITRTSGKAFTGNEPRHENLKRSNQHHAANPTRHLKRLLGMMLVTSV
jgi:hypothetical protein